MGQQTSAIVLISCKDQIGLVAAVTNFIHRNGGNIIDLEQHVDSQDHEFFMRVEWDITNFKIPADQLGEEFNLAIAQPLGMQVRLCFSSEKPRMAVFVSKMSHCLFDILSRYQSGEWNVEIPLIISNHPNLEKVATTLGIEFHCIPMTRETRQEQEKKQAALLQKHQIDFVVLARYMQIVSGDFIRQYQNRIINIHHSFLPAFPGAKPYHSAHQRGVKIIGATSHYVTEELDAGPIIAQDVVPVSHTDDIEDLVRKGRDLEKIVLARAIWHHLQNQILVWNNRTIVFQ